MASEHDNEEKEMEEAKDLFKGLKVGQDLEGSSGFHLGGRFLSDKSQLMAMREVFTSHFYLLQQTKKIADPLERMVQVVKYFLSCVRIGEFGKAVFLSTQGETLRGTITSQSHPDDVSTFAFEQVSDIPCISAAFLEDSHDGVQVEVTAAPSFQFWGTHLTCQMKGTRVFRLKDAHGGGDEEYHVEWPDLFVRFLRMHSEFVGQTKITCEKSGYISDFKFKAKPLVFGHWHAFEGSIVHESEPKKHLVEFEGRYTETVTFTNLKTKEKTVFDKHSLENVHVETINEPTSSEIVWGDVIESLKKGDTKEAEKIKATIDAHSHDLHKHGKCPEPKYFQKVGDKLFKYIRQ